LNLSLIISITSLVLVIAGFFYLRNYVKTRTGSKIILDQYRQEVNGMIADIDRCTERDSALVEERVKRLNALISDTDKKIGVLLKEEQEGKVSPARRKTKAKAALNITVLPEPLQPAPKPLDQQIAELYRAGADPALIADKLGISVAEVNLATAMIDRAR
jgi:Tfp pilus assembly protein PilN